MHKSKSKEYFMVMLQFLLFAFYFLLPSFNFYYHHQFLKISAVIICVSGIIICGIAVLQLNIHLSALPSPRKNSPLITTGIFKYMRHPIYTGIFLTALGYAFYIGSITKLIVAILLILLFTVKSSYEEKMMQNKFPEYEDYKNKTAKFFPFF